MKALLINWENAVNPARNELVFANRNKSYGAFAIRKAYDKDVLLSLTFSLALFIVTVGYGVFYYWKNKPVINFHKTISDKIEYQNIPFPIDKPIEINIPAPPKAIQIETRRFVNPTVTPDETITGDPIPPENYKGAIGTVTMHGTETNENLPPEIIIGIDTTKKVNLKIRDPFEIKQQPEYPGGIDQFYKDVYDKIKYPSNALEMGIEGSVPVQFVVETDGSMSTFKAFRNEAGFGDEAIRAMSELKKWKPGKDNGEAVRVRFTIMIKYKVNHD